MDWDREKERKAGRAIGIGGSIYGIVFILIWCGIAAAMGAWFMLIFGFPFVGFTAYRLAVLLKKSKAESKEKEPWEPQGSRPAAPGSVSNGFCPYCGERLEDRFAFCPKCGRRR